jgi:hypothetical protein
MTEIYIYIYIYLSHGSTFPFRFPPSLRSTRTFVLREDHTRSIRDASSSVFRHHAHAGPEISMGAPVILPRITSAGSISHEFVRPVASKRSLSSFPSTREYTPRD